MNFAVNKYFYYRSSHCIPKGVLRRVRDQKSVRLQKPLPAPVFMGLRPIPPLVYLCSCYDSPVVNGGYLLNVT